MVRPSGNDISVKQGIGTQKKNRQVYMLDGVPIFQAGKHKGKNYTIVELDEIVRNTNAFIKSNYLVPPIKLGHDDNQIFATSMGLPKMGDLVKTYRLGDTLYGDFSNIPEQMQSWIGDHYYDNVSVELYENFKAPVTGEDIGMTIRAVGFLGQDIPEIKGMGNIVLNNDHNGAIIVTFADKDLKEVNAMLDKWTIEDVSKIIPLYSDAVKKYFTDKNSTEIGKQELVELIAATKLDDAANKDTNDNHTEDTLNVRKDMLSNAMYSKNFTDLTKDEIIEVETFVEGTKDDWSKENYTEYVNTLKTKKEKDMACSKIKKMMELSPDQWNDEDIKSAGMQDFGEFVFADVSKFPNDERPPKGWWDKYFWLFFVMSE